MSRSWLLLAAFLAGIWFVGCGSSDEAPKKTASKATKKPAAKGSTTEAAPANDIQPISFGGTEGTPTGTSAASVKKGEPADEKSIVKALQPFNVLLGEWSGKTKKQFEGFAKIDSQKWVWDFKTDREQPSVAMASDKNIYFHHAWLTYVTDKQLFRMTVEEPDKQKRILEGTWTDGGEPRQESDGKKPQWTYKLQLTQVEPAEGDLLRVEFFLRENNEYMVTLFRKPAKSMQFTQVDVVRAQREGTSFAVADSDNPGPKCIVSGGLGTMTVTHNGKSYPVCCTGCKAAFEEDPERWLAKLAKQEAEMKKND